jgi:hypothetical protein
VKIIVFSLHLNRKKTKNIQTTITTTMQSQSTGTPTSEAQNTGTRPLTLIDAILYTEASNTADSQALPLPTAVSNNADSHALSLVPAAPTNDSESLDTGAVERTRFNMILDLAMALIEDSEADFKSFIDE